MILLDTHVLIWFWHGRAQLGCHAREIIEREWQARDAAVSAITFWEVGMLQEKGRIELPADLSAWRASLLRAGLVEVPVDGAIAARAGPCATFPATLATASSSPRPSKATGLSPPTPACSTGPVR